MKDDIAEALGLPVGNVGIVIFYSANRQNKTITEAGRTPVLPFEKAIDIYSETPNPASQLLSWKDEQDMQRVLDQHAKDIKDPNWLNELFDSI